MARVCLWESVGLSWPLEGDPAASVMGREWRRSQALVSSTQVCLDVRGALADPALEKCVLTVVLDTISAFFSSSSLRTAPPLQVGACCATASGQGEPECAYSRCLACISCQCCVTNCPQSTNMHYLTVSVGRELQWGTATDQEFLDSPGSRGDQGHQRGWPLPTKDKV